MQPPFSPAQFFDVFARYNEAVWPAQIVLIVTAVACALCAYRANARREWRWAQASFFLLAALWLWSGLAYHKLFFAKLTPVGQVFGSLFVAQAALLVIAAFENGVSFERATREGMFAGTALLAYALVLYPWIDVASGHHYPAMPTFGVPCPITIFTFAIFCMLPASVPRFALAIPVLWAAIGTTAAFSFGVREDLGLFVAAVAALVVIHHATHPHAPLHLTPS